MHCSRLRTRRARTAFTLVELLTVMAIIALLTAILIPVASRVMAGARRTEAGNNLHQIALAYATCINDGTQARTLKAGTLYDLALLLARDGGLNDAEVYIASDDPLVQASADKQPDAVAFNDNGTWSLNPDFAAYPLSVVVVSGIPANAPPSSTPVAWTRGLKADGTWSDATAAAPGVFGSTGGYVAFLDGHIEWHPHLKGDDGTGVLRNYATQRPTANIAEALPPGATALDAK